MIKVFKMNDCDWVAAESAESAIEGYKNHCDSCELDEMTLGMRALTDKEMDGFVYWDELRNEASDHRSFREELDNRIRENQTFPQFFASTEY